jgi:hypothetical protein
VKQLLLATALIAVPVAGFTAFTLLTAQAGVQSAGLGDLSPMKTIIADVQTIAATGDMKAAATRITDFETAWDDAAAAMRPLDPTAWGSVDQAADDALSALRTSAPTADTVTATLAALSGALANPAGGAAVAATAGAPVMVSGITISDASGRALPCEVMLKSLATALGTAKLADADKATAVGFQTKALERCNADDDQHADEFSAQGLAIATK